MYITININLFMSYTLKKKKLVPVNEFYIPVMMCFVSSLVIEYQILGFLLSSPRLLCNTSSS